MQNDFCSPNGSLFVPGADQDVIRVSKFVKRIGKKINDIHVTLDSHRTVQVFHPIFWCDASGKHPNPFTVIGVSDVEQGKWMTTNPSWRQRGLEYVKALAEKGRFPLVIWPYHTIIGSVGHSLVPCLSEALTDWEKSRFAMVDYCVKGDFYFSEAYGALESEVPAPEEASTMLNTRLVDMLQQADDLLIMGEALSHCVKNTVEQVAKAFGDVNLDKFVLMTDCCSNVPTFEKLGDDFVKNMVARGMRVSTSVDYLA
jgi:nicotinamidase-related amidase